MQIHLEALGPSWESEANLHHRQRLVPIVSFKHKEGRSRASQLDVSRLFRPRIRGLATDFHPEYSPPDYGVFGCDFPYWAGGEHTRVGLRGGVGAQVQVGRSGGRESGQVTSGLPSTTKWCSDNRCPPACQCQDIQAEQISAVQPVAGDSTVSG